MKNRARSGEVEEEEEVYPYLLFLCWRRQSHLNRRDNPVNKVAMCANTLSEGDG